MPVLPALFVSLLVMAYLYYGTATGKEKRGIMLSRTYITQLPLKKKAEINTRSFTNGSSASSLGTKYFPPTLHKQTHTRTHPSFPHFVLFEGK